MTQLVDKLLCKNLQTLKPYESARRLFSGGQDWLNANESPFSNDYQVNDSTFNRYPDCQPASVVSGYANYAKVQPEQVLVTRGADEGIELLIRAFCTPGEDNILICPPTYGMYAISAETVNVGCKIAPLNDDFSLDTSAINRYKGEVNLIFICSPNNPTGTSVDSNDVESILSHYADSALVIIDEAYIEFNDALCWSSLLNQYPNLVVLRTLSKAFALAGIRCGFTLANKSIIDALMKVIAPYPVPAPVAQIAQQALSSAGIAQMRQQVQYIQQQQKQIKQRLDKCSSVQLMGDDKANFVLFKTPHKQGLMDHLVTKGILIRDQSKQLNLTNCLRLTVGNEQQNERLLNEVERYLEKQENAA